MKWFGKSSTNADKESLLSHSNFVIEDDDEDADERLEKRLRNNRILVEKAMPEKQIEFNMDMVAAASHQQLLASKNRVGPTTHDDSIILSPQVLLADEKRSLGSFLSSIQGYFYAVLFAMCTSTATVFIKMSSSLVGSEHSTVRYLVQIIVMSAIILHKGHGFLGPKNHRNWLVARAVVGSSSVILGFFAIYYIHPSDVSTLNNSSVIITAIVARFLLKEKLTMIHFLATILTVIGVVCICRPTFIFGDVLTHYAAHAEHLVTHSLNSSQNDGVVINSPRLANNELNIPLGVTLVILSAVLMGTTQVIIKKLCIIKVHYSIVSFYPAALGLPTGLIVSLVLFLTNVSHDAAHPIDPEKLPYHILYSFVAGTAGTVALIFLNMALDHEDASRIAIVKTTDVMFTFLFQYLILHIKIDALGIVGAVFILTSTFSIIIFKLVDKKLEFDSKLMQVLFKKF